MSVRPGARPMTAVAGRLPIGCSAGGAQGSRRSDPAPVRGRPYVLYHCGVDQARVGSVHYVADRPLDDGNGNPPPGCGNPYQRGTMSRSSAGVAVFHDDLGHVIRFHVRPRATFLPAPLLVTATPD